MLTEDEVNNLIWIDEAFSKDYVDELEAARRLTDGQNRVYFGDQVVAILLTMRLILFFEEITGL